MAGLYPLCSSLKGLACLILAMLFDVNGTVMRVGAVGCNSPVDDVSYDVSLLDVWAGVSSFSDGFDKQPHVVVKEFAWIEWAAVAMLLLKHCHDAAHWCADFFDYAWRDWSFQHDLIVTAGPSCCPFSVSGKRLRQHDPRSGQGMETARLAVDLGALALIVENVTNFVDEDHLHHLVEEMDHFLLLNGMVAVGLWRLLDSKLGGASGRERVFLRWEKEDMASSLSPLVDEPEEQPRSVVQDYLEEVHLVEHLIIGGNSKFELWDEPVQLSYQATRVGSLWLRGSDEHWMVGEALKLHKDHRVWRILEILDDGWIKILFDCRRQPKFRWKHMSRLNFSQRCDLEWPVYSMDGVARAIRHTEFAPGDLYLDVRFESGAVRPLSGTEKWRLLGLSATKAEWLIGNGHGAQLGQLAGNSIPSCMTEAVACSEAERVKRYKKLRMCRQKGTFTLMQPVAGLHTKRLSATFLVCLGLSKSEVLLWNGEEIPGMVHEVSQKQAFEQAACWARGLGFEEAEHCILLEKPMGKSKARAIIHYDQCLIEVPEAAAVPIEDVMHLPIGELAVQSLLQVNRMVGEVMVPAGLNSGWVSGRVSGTAAYQPCDETATEVESKGFLEQYGGHESSISEMVRILEADGTEDMLDWKMRLGPTDLTDYPSSLRREFEPLSWCGVCVPDPHKAVVTEWEPLPDMPKHLEKRPAPQGWLSAVRPKFRMEAQRRVLAFRKKLTKWLKGESERPLAAVIPGDWLESWTFEAPHEFHSDPGWATPVDISRPSKTHLNLDFFAQQGAGYPDQELLSFLILGVRYKADLPVQLVLQPHLQSFLPVQDKYLLEADRFIERGWSFCMPELLIVPFFSAACGSVCRPLEPDRPRCTNDAGAPRQELWADDGIRVRSLNECIGEAYWPKEVKPSALDVAIAIRVLKEAADLLGLSVFIITDDYKSFFNQMRLAPSEYCKTGAMHPPRAGEEQASFAYDTVLGFGIKMASNVAQRFADFLVHIFRRAIRPAVLSEADKHCQRSAEFRNWWEERQKLDGGVTQLQATLVTMFMYCDDPCILSVGPDMTYEVLKVWNWMSRTGGTMMAIPEKRCFGLSSKWIGIKFFSALGVCSVPEQKVLRACTQMAQACENSLTRDQYRSLIGFLEHVRMALFLRGDKMYGLYEALSQDKEPWEMVCCNKLMHLQFQRWRSRLMLQAGTSVEQLPAFVSGRPMGKLPKELPARRFAIFSDAAKEGTDNPGIGGWMSGYTWVLPLTKQHLELDIPILEAVAAVVNVICAYRVLGGTDHLPPELKVEAHVDAQATVHVLIKGKGKSSMMKFVHTLALQCQEFKDMLPFLVVSHCLGLGNVASDAASRGYKRVLHIIATALSVKLIEIPPPEMAEWMLEQCLKQAAKSKHEHCWGAAGIRYGEADTPGPIFEPMQSYLTPLQSSDWQTTADKESSGRKRCFEAMDAASPDPHGAPRKVPDEQPTSFLPSINRQMVAGPLNPEGLAKLLWADTSEHAICVGNWDQLLHCCDVALATAGDAFSQRTAEADVGHWRAWSDYCKAMQTSSHRPQIDPILNRTAFLREVVLLVNALVHFMKTRKPRSSKDSVIKPQSAMNILLGANRVLKANFSSFIPLSHLKLPLKGLMRRFLQKFGPNSLIPKRREPFTNGMICGLVTLPYDTDLGPVGRLELGSIIRSAWNAAIALANCTGFRKAELFQSNESTHFLHWGNLGWIINGQPVKDPTDDQLRDLQKEDFLTVSPVPSKADQFNTVWGAHPLYVPFRPLPRNAAAAVRDLALTVGQSCRRAELPVFVGNDRKPLTGAHMAAALYKAMCRLVTPQRAKLYTWHSARIALATHLRKCGVPDSTIQALLRWQTAESLRTYARLSMDDCANMLDRAAKVTIAAVQAPNLPIYEQFDFFLALNELADAM